VLGVGLATCVYLWNASTCKVTKLCDQAPYDSVTSVNWMQRGTHIAVGTLQGSVQIWDVVAGTRLRNLNSHKSHVGTLAWNDHILSSGSRDKSIIHHDVRSPDPVVRRLTGHRQEVCGLNWNVDHQQLASGGNDNRLLVWDKMNDTPTLKLNDHTAAVKAIAWSPHQHGLLASGGGTADRHIRFWNTISGAPLNAIDTGSQVCNLAWSKTSNKLVSTHGYSQNQVVVWKYPSITPLATLTGHTSHVLYLAMSPNGQTVVTGAGDETLRFWNVFSKNRVSSAQRSLLDTFSRIR
jgi:cell division cycle 20-like protein 1 (cofactor of APC complex)